MLLVCWVALRTRALPSSLAWFGAVVGSLGLVSTVPILHDAVYAFGLLQIVWFTWLGVTLLGKPRTSEEKQTRRFSAAETPA